MIAPVGNFFKDMHHLRTFLSTLIIIIIMTKPSELQEQIELICIERNLDQSEVMAAIETAIAGAYRKEMGHRDHHYEATFNVEEGTYDILRVWEIVEKEPLPEGAELPEDPEEAAQYLNADREISVVEARLNDPNTRLGEFIKKPIADHQQIGFGRIASQVAKQVLIQYINNARHTKILQQFKEKVGDIVSVEIDYFKKGGYMVKLGQTNGFMRKEDLLPVDKFKPGQVIKALILEISEDPRGGSRVILSRTHADFVRAIIAKEVPEVEAGIVEIKKMVREAGSRTKILVAVSEDETQDIDPVGTILGRRNVRILNIMREISTSLQEKIDVIEYLPMDLETMLADSLEPAEIEDIQIDLDVRKAAVFCYPEEASLAVGKRGVNVRLASELLDLEIEIKTVEGEKPTVSNEPIVSAD